MHSPKGFAKNYFTFSAILAYSVQRYLNAQVSSIYSLISNKNQKQNDEVDEVDEDDPPFELLEPITLFCDKPCHCNCIYQIKTKLAVFLYHYIPRCPYYCTYFAYRRSGVHPPIKRFRN